MIRLKERKKGRSRMGGRQKLMRNKKKNRR